MFSSSPALMSCAPIRTRLPERRTLPCRRALTLRSLATSFMLFSVFLNRIAEVREMTLRFAIFDREVMISSVIPSLKYSSSMSWFMFLNGSTASEFSTAGAGRVRWRKSVAAMAQATRIVPTAPPRKSGTPLPPLLRPGEYSPKILCDLAGTLIPNLPVLFQASLDDLFERPRQTLTQRPGRCRSFVDDGIADCRLMLAAKRKSPCGELVENNAKGKQVGPMIDLFALNLLGRHVRRRPDGASCPGQMGGSPQPRQSKVRDLDLPIFGQHHVIGLHVAMNDAPLVSMAQTLRGLDPVLNDILQWKFLAGEVKGFDRRLERSAPEVFENEELSPLYVIHLEDCCDMRVVERGDRLSLLLKSFERVGKLQKVFGKELDGHDAVESLVPGFIDHAHAPLAQLLEDLIMGNSPADHRREDCLQDGNIFTLQS